MGRLTSSIGLITGTPIKDTVDQLIDLSSISRNRLSNRNDGLKQQRNALTDLTVLTIGVQLASRGFGSTSIFESTKVATSDTSSVLATRTGLPEVGTYKVRTLQTAGTQAFKSSNFASSTKALGTAGAITIRGGGYVDRSVALADLNSGRGVAAGSIRITDRSGAHAIIDLSNATTVDDVLKAINSSSDIRVTASTNGDAIQLTDRTGSTDSNLIVEEVGAGETAIDLGLRNINVSANSAIGSDIYRLTESSTLTSLRDGRGIDFASGADLEVAFRDGTSLEIDFGDFSREASNATGATGSLVENAGLTFTATEEGSVGDGVRVRFIDDESITAGSETVQRIETASGTELVFSIDAGTTTAADIVAALESSGELAEEFSATADGDGSGIVSVADTAELSGGGAIEAPDDPTLADLLRVINAADPSRLRAELSPGADTIRIIDLTSGLEDFSVSDLGSGSVAINLGFNSEAVDGVITGTRLQSGLSTVSLSALGGGSGLGALTTLDITTADGGSGSVDVSTAINLQDVINAVNSSGLLVEASIDSSGGALQIRDLSGGSSQAFSVTSSDETASKLGLSATTSDVLIRGSNLNLQFVSRSSKLSDLNQGRGVGGGSFTVTSSDGRLTAINLAVDDVTTVGDLIDRINNADIGVNAEINETGDGIRLIDVAEGEGQLTVEDSGSGESADLLGLAGIATNEVIDGQIVSTINGRQVDTISFTTSDTLSSIAEKIREESRFLTATLISGPSGTAALSVTSRRGGDFGRVSVHSSGVDFNFDETNRGRDAVIAIGGDDGGNPTLLRSVDGVFSNGISGVTLTAKAVSDEAATISIEEDRSTSESAVKRFVDQYNRVIDRVKELTRFDSATNEIGLLFGRSETVRIQSSLSQVFTTRIATSGSIRTAADVGLRLDASGKLTLDSEKFQAALDKEPDAVKEFFTKEIPSSNSDSETVKVGFSAKVDEILERISGAENGLLISRSEALDNQIDRNDQRITGMNARLESERERLLKQFNAMESAIAKLQSNQRYLSSISYIGDLTASG